MSSVFDRALPRRSPDAQVWRAEEQVPFHLADARRERLELARKRVARNRTGERHGT